MVFETHPSNLTPFSLASPTRNCMVHGREYVEKMNEKCLSPHEEEHL
jgi:hypothetical protein